MPQMTQRQWEEYQAIIKKCRQMELESRSAKALQAQIDKLTERERSMTESHTQLVTYLNMQVATLTECQRHGLRYSGVPPEVHARGPKCRSSAQ